MAKINKKPAVLIIGRFQPFHMGHFHVLKDALRNFGFINIVIGSSQEDYTPENPMTSFEREKMIESVFKSLGVNRKTFKIISLPDIPTNSLWANYIAKKIKGGIDEVLTASPLTKLLFEDSGYVVNFHPLYMRKKYSGTEIRMRMVRRKNWDTLVPFSVFIYLQKLGISDRIKEIFSNDNSYV